MATCVSPPFTPSGTQISVGRRILTENRIGKTVIFKRFDKKSGSRVAYERNVFSIPQTRCSVNSHNISPNHGKDSFLDLHPEVSMLRSDANDTYSSLIKETSGGNVTESSGDSSFTSNYNEAKIKVIGVGGGGSNAVNRMIESSLTGVDFWIVNTDIQAMKMSPVLPENRLQVGKELTRGLGAGGNPDVGMNAANESKAAIEEALYGADMVFITVCLCSFPIC
ncbi:CELL DIVISION PROTEIN FTSZ-RELATED [Salix koriyanagi]|uniref:CELL DIVISION PROTEIN FTSZ-RELATED n=1 Tax=Salix koriyanagi TaxID=2511006 RepID=A0A9Q0TSY9_9ROSI|nr:CELL DIVISION PROTEIN FTSZ-RELATED [Salix koriyanagi]